MSKFKLVPYSIRVKELWTEKYIDLTKIQSGSNTITLLDIFQQLVKKHSTNPYVRNFDKKTLSIENKSLRSTGRTISGILKSGEYGFEADFYDTKHSKRISSARKEEYSEELPFFFNGCLPTKNKNMGFLVLEKIKQFGVKSILQRALNDLVKSHNEKLVVELNALINNELLKMLTSRKLVEIKFIKKKDTKRRCREKSYRKL